MFSSGRRFFSALGDQTDSLDTDKRSQVLSVPPPSVWPEPGRQSITVAQKPVPETTTTTLPVPIPTTKSKAQDVRRHVKHVRFELAEPQVTTQTKPSLLESALPLSTPVNGSQSSRAVDPVFPPIFEERYPRWHVFPPPYPTTFDSRRPNSSTAEGSLRIPLNSYLRQSATFQDWVNEQNESRIAIRHNSVYQNLLEVQHKFEYLATESHWPENRAEAKHWLFRLDQILAKEREKFSKDELRRIKDIEKGFLAFVNVHNDEETGRDQKKQTPLVQSVPQPTLSRVEMLLGKDGSQPCDEWTPYWTHETLPEDGEVAPWDGLETPPSPVKQMSTTKRRRGSFNTEIPEWFLVGEEEGIIVADGRTFDDRWFNFCRQIVEMEEIMKIHEDDKKRDKVQSEPGPQWHKPHPGWPTPQRQVAGGLWRCRKGYMATPAENSCKLCPNIPWPEPNMYYEAQYRLERLMMRVARSMAVAAQPLDEADRIKKPKGNQIWVRGVLVHQD